MTIYENPYRKDPVIVILDGRTDHPKYSVYKGMTDRCYKPDHSAYRWYGEEGVVVCDEWLDPYEGFWKFVEWHDQNIPEGMTMDKDNAAKLYSPETVKAGTNMQQRLNTRAIKSHNTSGTQGVRWVESVGAWSCNMDIFKQKVFIGNFDSQEEAKSVYDAIYSYRLSNPEDQEGVLELVEFYKEVREDQKLDLKLSTNWKRVISLQGEIWKSFPDFPNYAFSNLGRAFAFSDMCIMNPCKSIKDGLYALKIRYKGKSRKTNLSRIVGELFVPNPDDKPMVCFKDGDNSNLHFENLIWLDRKQLMAKNIKDGKYSNSGEDAANSKLSNGDVNFIRSNFKTLGLKLTAKQLSEQFGISVNTVYHIFNRKTFKEI